MSYQYKIKMLETKFNDLEVKIAATNRDQSLDENVKTQHLTSLVMQRSIVIDELREVRKLAYEESQRVDFGDDR
jgi:hypothetical protein